MKIIQLIKIVLSCGILIISFFHAYTQHLPDISKSHKCSMAKKHGYYNFKSKDIVQSSLLHDYDVKFYFLDLNVEDNSIYISGNVSINARVVAEELDTFAFELVDELIIDSVLVNQISQSFTHFSDEAFVPLDSQFEEGEDFTVQVYYHGDPPTGGFFSGISTQYDSTWNKHVTWTLSEPFNARQWWPVKQVLTDKADSVWAFFTTSSPNKVGSQGVLTAVTELPDNKLRYEWKSKYPIDYYLISFSVAEYQDYTIYSNPAELIGDSVKIQNYIYDSPGCLTHYKSGLDRTAVYLEFLSEKFSLYPFHEEKYGHCQAPLSGGMEHQTMTTIDGFGISIVSHELAHMWFGDNVTCATWSDIWLNEGFATYADYMATYDYAGGDWPKLWMSLAHNFVKSEPGGSVYVPPEEIAYDNVDRIFDARLSYYKGALILHMIRFELQNDDLFFQTFKNYQFQFADSTATANNFISVLNETTSTDFTDFFDQWYYGEGYPIYYISWVQQNNILELNSSQVSSIPEVTPFYKMHIPFKLSFNDGTDSTINLHQTNNEMAFTLPFQKTIDSIQVDPDNWVLKEVAYLNNVNEYEQEREFGIYPNPVINELNIKCHPKDIITITNLSGKVVIETIVKYQKLSMDVSVLMPGTYLLKIDSDLKKYTTKFIKL